MQTPENKIRNVQTHEDDTWLYGDRYEGNTLIGSWVQLKDHIRQKSVTPKESVAFNMLCPHDKIIDVDKSHVPRVLTCHLCGRVYAT